MGIEGDLQKNLFSKQRDQTSTDKVLGRKDVDEIRDLIRKPQLTREELLELLYLLAATESKLVNYDAWNRYIILKYFVWVREFVKCAEMMYDHKDWLEKQQKEGKIVLTPLAQKSFNNNQALMEHNIKYLVDLYLNIARTSLSLNAKGFDGILNDKHEIIYGGLNPTPQQPENKGVLSFRR